MLKVTTVSDLLQCPGDDRLADIGLKGSKDESGSCYITITMPLLSASIMTLLLVFTGVIRTIKRGSIKLKVNKKRSPCYSATRASSCVETARREPRLAKEAGDTFWSFWNPIRGEFWQV